MVIWHPVLRFSVHLCGWSTLFLDIPNVHDQRSHLCCSWITFATCRPYFLWFIEGLRGNDGGWYLFFVQHDDKTLKFHMFFQHGYPKKKWSPVFERKTLGPVSSFIKVSCSVFILKFYCNVWYFWWDPSNRIPEKKGLPFDEILLNFIL